MYHPSMSARRIAGFGLLGAALLYAQDWKTAAELPGVNLTGLTAAKKALALKAMRNQACPCGCAMKVAECRVADPACTSSRAVASLVLETIKKGTTEAGLLATLKASPVANPPKPKLLDDPVAIPTVGSPFTGPKDAPITLVEFSDFQCPYCAKAVTHLAAILKAYPTQVKLIFKEYPLDSHSQAAVAAAGALAAHQQGKFWQMHDGLFANRERLSRRTVLDLATALKLDMKRFAADLDSAETKKAVARDMEDGDRARVDSTPTVFIDGQKYNGALEPGALGPVIEAELKRLVPKTQ